MNVMVMTKYIFLLFNTMCLAQLTPFEKQVRATCLSVTSVTDFMQKRMSLHYVTLDEMEAIMQKSRPLTIAELALADQCQAIGQTLSGSAIWYLFLSRCACSYLEYSHENLLKIDIAPLLAFGVFALALGAYGDGILRQDAPYEKALYYIRRYRDLYENPHMPQRTLIVSTSDDEIKTFEVD